MNTCADDSYSLLPRESLTEYRELHKRIAGALKQNDLFEQFWVVDLTNQVWEAARYRRMAVALVQGSMQRGMQRLLAPMVDLPAGEEEIFGQFSEQLPSEKLAQGYFAGDAIAGEHVDKLLQRAGLNWEAVQAEAVTLRSAEFQRINQLLAKAETRRAATLRAIERHRKGLGAQLELINQEFMHGGGDDATAVPTPKLAA